MRITNIDERHFYEIEAAKNDWSLSEVKRQFNSSLYECLALSKDKRAVAQLVTEEQMLLVSCGFMIKEMEIIPKNANRS